MFVLVLALEKKEKDPKKTISPVFVTPDDKMLSADFMVNQHISLSSLIASLDQPHLITKFHTLKIGRKCTHIVPLRCYN